MNNIIYRKLELQDLDEFIKIRITQLKEEGSTSDIDLTKNLKDHFIKHIGDGTFVSYIAVCNNEIIATSGMSFIEKPPFFENPSGKIGMISGMYTKKEFRRKGIAKVLLSLVVQSAKEYGCGIIYVTSSNVGVNFYKDFGFNHNNNFFQLKI